MKCLYHLCQNDVHALTKKAKRFCSRKCCLKFRVKEWRIKLKKKAIEYKGGSCYICGYHKSAWSMHFHHRDRKEKEFNISRGGCTRGWEKVKAELDKYDLVCSNCHGEIEEALAYQT